MRILGAYCRKGHGQNYAQFLANLAQMSLILEKSTMELASIPLPDLLPKLQNAPMAESTISGLSLAYLMKKYNSAFLNGGSLGEKRVVPPLFSTPQEVDLSDALANSLIQKLEVIFRENEYRESTVTPPEVQAVLREFNMWSPLVSSPSLLARTLLSKLTSSPPESRLHSMTQVAKLKEKFKFQILLSPIPPFRSTFWPNLRPCFRQKMILEGWISFSVPPPEK